MLRFIGICAAFAIMGTIAIRAFSEPGSGPVAAPASVKAREPQAIEKFNLTRSVARREGFGAVGVFDLTFRNDNDYPVKDARVVCEITGRSGTIISRLEKTVFEPFPANSTKTVRNLTMGFLNEQGATAICQVKQVSR